MPQQEKEEGTGEELNFFGHAPGQTMQTSIAGQAAPDALN